MQYTGLITKMITVADESIQIIIQDSTDFDSFKDSVLEALKVTDKRAAIHQHRLLEDTSLTDKLSNNELVAVNTAANIFYPMEYTIDIDKLKQAKFEFAKNMASGEVLKIFLHDVDKYEDLHTALESIFTLLDNRLVETNTREIDFMNYYRTLPYDTRLKVAMIMDILYGRSTTDMVKTRLEESNTHEDTQVLEDMRNGSY